MFRGANSGSGRSNGKFKKPIMRTKLKLMSTLAENHPYLNVIFSHINHQKDWIKKIIPKEYQKLEKKPLHFDLNYKYLIAIDGWVSGWLRGPLILKSNSVPLVVDSKYKPLYFEQWLPYVHYIPVKRNLSDLISQIKWLQNNDDLAFKIAQNGNDLYE
jgi:hypothetical protein